jgi:TetR/AcrR family transcriptional repressor of nem operon
METTTREKIIASGAQAIIGKSYNAVGLNEILTAAGVPKGSFYHFFKSKEDFGVAVVDYFADKSAEHLRTMLRNPSRAPLARLRHWFESARDNLAQNAFRRQWLMAKTALEMGGSSEPIRLAVKDGLDRLRTIIAQCIHEGQVEGGITTRHDAEMLADLLLNAWEGVLMRAQLNRDERPIEAFLKVTIDELLMP